MNVVFSTGHPAQIHNFRFVREELLRHGHNVFWLATNKDISVHLLKIYGIPFTLLERPQKSFISRLKVLYKNVRNSLSFFREKKVDVIVSRGDPYTSIAGFLMGLTHITLNDTENAASVGKYFARLVSVVFVPNCFKAVLRKDQFKFAGNIELFYTHPLRFIPQSPKQLLGIGADTRYAIVRFVKWDAYHDVKLAKGFTLDQKVELIKQLSEHLKVFISSEETLPKQLESYKVNIPLEKMHDVLAYAELMIGESATMASESVMLGTPAIYVDEVGRGYTDEEAKAGLLYMFHPNQQEEAIKKAVEVVSPSFDRDLFAQKQKKFLSEKIDPTAFLTWFIENFPESKSIMEKNPDYQYRFK